MNGTFVLAVPALAVCLDPQWRTKMPPCKECSRWIRLAPGTLQAPKGRDGRKDWWDGKKPGG